MILNNIKEEETETNKKESQKFASSKDLCCFYSCENPVIDYLHKVFEGLPVNEIHHWINS